MVTVAVAAPEIGQSYAGGKVAYILKEGDPGHVAGETHGLIAATVDQSTGAAWAVAAYQRFAVPGGTDTALGTGSVNTTSIVAQNGAGSTYAAGLADVYTNADTGTGIYSDWYLPSKDELNKLFINRVAIGGFAADFYWSSSELAGYPGEAWGQYFVNGNQDAGVKSLTQHRVRAVRSF